MLHLCPSCRNAERDKRIVETSDGTAVAACPECGERFEFPYRTLYTLEGAPATGKSTTAGRLRNVVDPVVYEGDAHADLTAGTLPWEDLCGLDLRICMTLHAAGRQALFVGGVYPHRLEDSPETRYFDGIERFALACSDEELLARSREREGRAVPEEMDYLHEVNRWYREEGAAAGIEVIDTSTHGPEAVVERVVSRIEG